MRLVFRDFPATYWTADQIDIEQARMVREVLPELVKPVKRQDVRLRARRARKASEVIYCVLLCRAVVEQMRKRGAEQYHDLHEKHRQKARDEADHKMQTVVSRRMPAHDLLRHMTEQEIDEEKKRWGR